MSTLFFIFLEKFVISLRKIKNQHSAMSQSVDFCSSWQNFIGFKVQFVSGYELEIHAIPDAFHRQSVAGAVQMPVKAAAHIVALQQLQDLTALVPFVLGWIMQEYHLRQIAGRL